MALLPYNASRTNIKNAKAIQQIEKIKRNKLEKDEQKRLEDERKKLQSARKKKKLKEQIEKRKYELGIGTNLKDEPMMLIYKDGALEQDQEKYKKALSKMMIP